MQKDYFSPGEQICIIKCLDFAPKYFQLFAYLIFRIIKSGYNFHLFSGFNKLGATKNTQMDQTGKFLLHWMLVFLQNILYLTAVNLNVESKTAAKLTESSKPAFWYSGILLKQRSSPRNGFIHTWRRHWILVSNFTLV